MSNYIELSELLNDPSLSPEMRTFVTKLNELSKVSKLPKRVKRAFIYTKPQEYFLELCINCLCCGGERKELYFMKDDKDGSLRAKPYWLMKGSPRPEGIKEKKIRVHTCGLCKINLEKLSKEELINKLYGVFEDVLRQAVEMPQKPRLKIRDFNKEE